MNEQSNQIEPPKPPTERGRRILGSVSVIMMLAAIPLILNGFKECISGNPAGLGNVGLGAGLGFWAANNFYYLATH